MAIALTFSFVAAFPDGRISFRNMLPSPSILRRQLAAPETASGSRSLCSQILSPLRVQGEMQIRRCSPLLESAFLSSDRVLASDIWRYSAERFGDRVALADPYHDPSLTLTYKPLEQEILDFAEGLRVIGISPGEKLALFAGNSCRWLVADQGIHRVRVVGFPRCSDQATNAKLLEDVWMTGKTVGRNEKGVAESGEIQRCIEMVMEGEELRRNAKKWMDLAKEAAMEVRGRT